LTALHRYDGPEFRVVRRYLASAAGADDEPEVYILSARYGLIHSSTPISLYDQRLGIKPPASFRLHVSRRLNAALEQHQADDIFVSASADYLRLFPFTTDLQTGRMVVADGTRASRLARLHDWLYKQEPAVRAVYRGRSRLRDIEIVYTTQEIVDRACAALAEAPEAAIPAAWAARIRDHLVSPKWLISVLTGLGRGEFHTDAARRVLAELGIAVVRK
jgi:hypothetical protein